MLISCALLIGVSVVCLGVVAAVQTGLNQTCCCGVEKSWQAFRSRPPHFGPHWLQDPCACLHHFGTRVVDLSAIAAAVAAAAVAAAAVAAAVAAAAAEGTSPTAAADVVAAAAGAAAAPQGMHEDQPRSRLACCAENLGIAPADCWSWPCEIVAGQKLDSAPVGSCASDQSCCSPRQLSAESACSAARNHAPPALRSAYTHKA